MADAVCPAGNNCVVISKKTTSGDEVMHLLEVELYQGTTKLLTSSLAFTLSSTWDNDTPASNCNNGVTSPSSHSASCHTAAGDRNAWLLINAGTQTFTRVVVYNRLEGYQYRIDPATLTIYSGSTVTTPAVTFSSKGSSLDSYTFADASCPSGNNCVVIS